RCRTAPIPAAARRVRRSDRSTAASASPAHAVRVKTRKTEPLVELAAPPSLHFIPRPTTGVNQRPQTRATLSFSTQSPPFRTLGDSIPATSGRLETDVPARSQKSVSLRFGIGETCMSEAVEVDSEKRLN